MNKSFKMAVILSVYHDKLMCGFDDTREFMDYMTGEHVYLWDIPQAMKLCRKSLGIQHPWIKQHAMNPEAKPDSYSKFVRKAISIYGQEVIEVTPLKSGQFKARSCSESLT